MAQIVSATVAGGKVLASQQQADRLMQARCRLMMREPWYGHVAMSMVWIPSEMSWREEGARTMGVRIVNGGEIQCLYYSKFVDSLTIKELYAVIQHEIEHIVRAHCIRASDREPQVWNIACDFCVNGPRTAPRIGYEDPSTGELIIPFKDKLCWIPQSWPKDGTAEQFYDMLIKHGNTGGSFAGQILDDHSVWSQSDVSQDEARQIVKDVVDQATQKCQGHSPGHLAEAINSLSKPVVRWRELLRHYLGKHVGSQRSTYSRRNRRHDWFGMPGISHHAAARVNVIVDTSGSIGQRELEQFFAEIDAISARAKTTILQWDHAFQGFGQYRRGDWKKFSVKGRGGTDMAAPVQWLIDNKLIADVQVMLTDGYCNYLNDSRVNFPFITVITTPEGTTSGPDYGHVVRMCVNNR